MKSTLFFIFQDCFLCSLHTFFPVFVIFSYRHDRSGSMMRQLICNEGQPFLLTSTQPWKKQAYFSSSPQVISMALLEPPAAGNTVS